MALFVDGHEVLLLDQATPPEPDRWDLPGGGLNPTEDLITGLRREVAEETGLTDFQIERLLTVAEGFYPRPYGQLHNLHIIYLCSVSPKPTTFHCSDPQEVGDRGIRWLPATTLTAADCSNRAWQALISAGLVHPMA